MTTLFNGALSEFVPDDNRGLAFGDGLFETLLVQNGKPHWLEEHLLRLRRGCKQLNLDFPEAELFRDIHQLQGRQGTGRGVLKIILWRKSLHRRGYRPVTTQADRLVSLNDLPVASRQAWQQGIRVEISPQRLSIQPQLAGLKHLNRLEQVMAGNALSAGAQEALLQDQSGRLIEAISANLFLVKDGQLLTPSLTDCGVAGIVRKKIVGYWQEQKKEPVMIAPVFLSTLYAAQEVFICNSLIGITPVTAIGCHQKSIGPVTRDIQQHFEPCWYA